MTCPKCGSEDLQILDEQFGHGVLPVMPSVWKPRQNIGFLLNPRIIRTVQKRRCAICGHEWRAEWEHSDPRLLRVETAISASGLNDGPIPGKREEEE